MNELSNFMVGVVIFLVGAILGSVVGGTHGELSFTDTQCTIAPTGRVHKDVVAVRADEGKPVGVVESVTAIEYATVCDKTEWRK